MKKASIVAELAALRMEVLEKEDPLKMPKEEPQKRARRRKRKTRRRRTDNACSVN